MLAEGAVHLTAVRRLAPHLTPENHVEVLQSARGKTKREVEEIVARLAPQPDVPVLGPTGVRLFKGAFGRGGGGRGGSPPVPGSPPDPVVPGHAADETGMGPLRLWFHRRLPSSRRPVERCAGLSRVPLSVR